MNRVPNTVANVVGLVHRSQADLINDEREVQALADLASTWPSRLRPASKKIGWVLPIFVVSGAAFVLVWQSTSRPPTSQPRPIVIDTPAPRPPVIIEGGPYPHSLRLPDGTVFIVAANTRIQVSETIPGNSIVHLLSGRIDATAPTSRQPRSVVYAGPFVLDVLAASFYAEWKPEPKALVVGCDSGEVMVKGPLVDQGLKVTHGQRMIVELDRSKVELGPPPVTVVPLPAARTKPIVASPEQRLRWGDVARIERRWQDARFRYEALIKDFPLSSYAADAMFSLGVAAMSQSDMPLAIKMFTGYLKQFPSGGLVREAEGRLLESLAGAQRLDDARLAAQRYLTKYPTGPHSSLARRLTR